MSGPHGDQAKEITRRRKENRILREEEENPKKATVFFAYLTSPGNHRADGNQAGHALIFKLDHSMGAYHGSRTPMERL